MMGLTSSSSLEAFFGGVGWRRRRSSQERVSADAKKKDGRAGRGESSPRLTTVRAVSEALEPNLSAKQSGVRRLLGLARRGRGVRKTKCPQARCREGRRYVPPFVVVLAHLKRPRGRPKELHHSLSLSLSLRPNTRDSRSTQSHGNERMPSLVGNLVVALGRGRSRLPAPPWLALLVPVSAKSCLFFFLAPCRERCRVNTGFLHEAECKFKPREQKKKSGTFPSFDRDRDQTHRCVERRAGHGAGHPNEEGCRGVSGGERNVAEEEALAESSGDPARRSSHRFWMRTSRSHG